MASRDHAHTADIALDDLRPRLTRLVQSAFSKLLAGEYNPAMQGYQHRQANKEAALGWAVDEIVALFAEQAASSPAPALSDRSREEQ